MAERTHYYTACGLETDQDVNAALNLMQLATARSAGDDGNAIIQACGELVLAGL